MCAIKMEAVGNTDSLGKESKQDYCSADFVNFLLSELNFDEEIPIEFENIEAKTTNFPCTNCSKVYKTASGLKRHFKSRHEEAFPTLKEKEGSIDRATLEGLVQEAQTEIYSDNCYDITRRDKINSFTCSRFENKNLKTLVDIYTELVKTNNIENYFSQFYSLVAVNAEEFFQGLQKPDCTLLATVFANKLFAYKDRKVKDCSKNQYEAIADLSEREIDGLQYIVGYIIQKFLQKAKCSKISDNSEKQAIICILNNAKIYNCSDQKLINTLDRGGLTAVSRECQEIFIIAEKIFRKATVVKNVRKIDIDMLVEELIKDIKVIESFNSFSDISSIDDEIKLNLLENMLRVFLKIRSFSLVNDITTKFVNQKKQKRGLRKSLKKVQKL